MKLKKLIKYLHEPDLFDDTIIELHKKKVIFYLSSTKKVKILSIYYNREDDSIAVDLG